MWAFSEILVTSGQSSLLREKRSLKTSYMTKTLSRVGHQYANLSQKTESQCQSRVLPYRVGMSDRWDRSVAVELFGVSLVDNREPNQTREVGELGWKCRSWVGLSLYSYSFGKKTTSKRLRAGYDYACWSLCSGGGWYDEREDILESLTPITDSRPRRLASTPDALTRFSINFRL